MFTMLSTILGSLRDPELTSAMPIHAEVMLSGPHEAIRSSLVQVQVQGQCCQSEGKKKPSAEPNTTNNNCLPCKCKVPEMGQVVAKYSSVPVSEGQQIDDGHEVTVDCQNPQYEFLGHRTNGGIVKCVSGKWELIKANSNAVNTPLAMGAWKCEDAPPMISSNFQQILPQKDDQQEIDHQLKIDHRQANDQQEPHQQDIDQRLDQHEPNPAQSEIDCLIDEIKKHRQHFNPDVIQKLEKADDSQRIMLLGEHLERIKQEDVYREKCRELREEEVREKNLRQQNLDDDKLRQWKIRKEELDHEERDLQALRDRWQGLNSAQDRQELHSARATLPPCKEGRENIEFYKGGQSKRCRDLDTSKTDCDDFIVDAEDNWEQEKLYAWQVCAECKRCIESVLTDPDYQGWLDQLDTAVAEESDAVYDILKLAEEQDLDRQALQDYANQSQENHFQERTEQLQQQRDELEQERKQREAKMREREELISILDPQPPMPALLVCPLEYLYNLVYGTSTISSKETLERAQDLKQHYEQTIEPETPRDDLLTFEERKALLNLSYAPITVQELENLLITRSRNRENADQIRAKVSTQAWRHNRFAGRMQLSPEYRDLDSLVIQAIEEGMLRNKETGEFVTLKEFIETRKEYVRKKDQSS